MWQRKNPENTNENNGQKNFWLLLSGVLVVILAVLLFGRAYWQKQEAAFFDDKQLFEQITELKGQINELQQNLIKKEEPEKPIERIAIVKETMPKITNCDEATFYDVPENIDRGDKTVAYLNQDKNISLDVPYNESWGARRYKLNPYDEVKTDEMVSGLEFGPAIIFRGSETKECDWTRKYSLTFLPAQTATKALAEIKKIDPNAEKKEINGYTIIEYTKTGDLFGLPASPLLIRVLDKKASYEFQQITELWSSLMPTFEDLENIIKTLKPLE
jgi:hypothetical protein